MQLASDVLLDVPPLYYALSTKHIVHLSAMYHESILQKVAYVAFEMGKESEFSRLTQDQMLTLVEFQTRKAYEKACQKLLENGQISQESFDKAMNLSNVDEYSTDKLNGLLLVGH